MIQSSELIEELRVSPFYDELFHSERPVIMIYVSGSRILGTEGVLDERSDFDLVVVTDGQLQEEQAEYLLYKKTKVHWYFRSVEDIKGPGDPRCTLGDYGNVLFGYLTESVIIYENPQYAAMIAELKDQRREIALRGARVLYERFRGFVDGIVSAGQIEKRHYSKFIAHLCVTSFFVRGEPIDEELIRVVKRIRWQPVSDEIKARAVERLRLLKEYFEAEDN